MNASETKIKYDEEKAKSVIKFIINNAGSLSERMIMKLYYSAEIMSIIKNDCRISDVNYINYDYGPWSYELKEVLHSMDDELDIKEFTNGENGRKGKIFSPTKKSKLDITLEAVEKEIIKSQIIFWKRRLRNDTDRMVMHTKTTPPYIWHEDRKRINFDQFQSFIRELKSDSNRKTNIDLSMENLKEGKFSTIQI